MVTVDNAAVALAKVVLDVEVLKVDMDGMDMEVLDAEVLELDAVKPIVVTTDGCPALYVSPIAFIKPLGCLTKSGDQICSPHTWKLYQVCAINAACCINGPIKAVVAVISSVGALCDSSVTYEIVYVGRLLSYAE